MELIDLPQIFHDPLVKSCLPIDVKFDDNTFAYSLTNPIISKIFNFKKFVSNLDVKAIFQDNTILPIPFFILKKFTNEIYVKYPFSVIRFVS